MSEISSIHKKRDYLIECISNISVHVDEFEKSGGCNADLLQIYKKRIDDAWSQVTVAQEELADVNKEEPTDLTEAQQKYRALVERLTKLIDNARLSTISTPIFSGVSPPAIARTTTIKLPAIQLPTLMAPSKTGIPFITSSM